MLISRIFNWTETTNSVIFLSVSVNNFTKFAFYDSSEFIFWVQKFGIRIL